MHRVRAVPLAVVALPLGVTTDSRAPEWVAGQGGVVVAMVLLGVGEIDLAQPVHHHEEGVELHVGPASQRLHAGGHVCPSL